MSRFVSIIVLAVLATACGGSSEPQADVNTQPADTTHAPSTTTTTRAPTTTTSSTTSTTTAATTTTAAAQGIVSGADAEVDAVVLAYQVAFDAASSFEDKAAFIDDPSGLEETIATYLETGASVGGITVLASEVSITGDTADVVYDLLFAGNPTYPDLTGTAVKTQNGWKVPRNVFCALMSAARVGCP